MTILLTILIIGAICLIILGIAIPSMGRDAVAARLETFAQRPRSLEEMELEQPFSERVLRPIIQRLAKFGQRFKRQPRVQTARDMESSVDKTRRRLVLAGNPNRWTESDWLGVKLFVALCAAGIGGLLMMLVNVGFLLLGALGGGVIGFLLPEFWLGRKIKQRQKEIIRALPDAMDLLVISVEAGLGFDAALARVVAKADNALTREFARMMAEMRVGRPRREALKEMVARTEVDDLTNFVSALVQAEQLGVSVVQVLVVQADQMRTVRRQRAEEQAQQAPLKMLFPMMGFIFPALCIMILGPLWPAISGMNK
jgi:tight adherence protein C